VYGLVPPVAFAVHVTGVPAGEGNDALAVRDVIDSGFMPRCFTVTVPVPIVNVPVRSVAETFAVVDSATVPLPLRPPVAVSQPTLLAVLHEQPAAVATATDAVLAVDGRANAVLESEYVHGTPACATVTVWPATVSRPLRGVPAVFAATEKRATPTPARLVGPVSVIHPALLFAVQAQPLAVVTVMLPVPPPAVTAAFVVESA